MRRPRRRGAVSVGASVRGVAAAGRPRPRSRVGAGQRRVDGDRQAHLQVELGAERVGDLRAQPLLEDSLVKSFGTASSAVGVDQPDEAGKPQEGRCCAGSPASVSVPRVPCQIAA